MGEDRHHCTRSQQTAESRSHTRLWLIWTLSSTQIQLFQSSIAQKNLQQSIAQKCLQSSIAQRRMIDGTQSITKLTPSMTMSSPTVSFFETNAFSCTFCHCPV